MSNTIWNKFSHGVQNACTQTAQFCKKQAHKIEHNFNNRSDTGKALLIGTAFVGAVLNPIGFPIAFAVSYAISDQCGDVVDRVKNTWDKQPFGVKATLVLTGCVVMLFAPNIIAGAVLGGLVGMELGQGQPGSSGAGDMLKDWKNKIVALFRRDDHQNDNLSTAPALDAIRV